MHFFPWPLSCRTKALRDHQASEVKGPGGAWGGLYRWHHHWNQGPQISLSLTFTLGLSSPHPSSPTLLTPAEGPTLPDKGQHGGEGLCLPGLNSLCHQSRTPASAARVCEEGPSLSEITPHPWSPGKMPHQHKLLSLGVTGSDLH